MRRVVALLAGLALAAPGALAAQARTHVLLVVGLGGTAEYREAFHEQAVRLSESLVEHHGVAAEDVTYLGERVDVAPDVIDGRATKDGVLEALGAIAGRAGAADRVLVVLFGHGTTGSGGTAFNLSGPDLGPADLAPALDALGDRPVAFVHTGSGSGAFVEPLSKQGRIVVTATRTERELNATHFGAYFVDALAGDGADIDRDGTVSILEAYTYARREVARRYQDENEILTENALLEDDGDGKGTYEASADAGGDGALAARFHLGGAATAAIPETDDPVLARLYRERADIQRRIDELRALQGSIEEERYLAEMEALLVELALKNREIRDAGGGT